MEIWIYFDYRIIIKTTYNSCRLRSPTVASIQTSTVVYKYRITFHHFHWLISSHLSLSTAQKRVSSLLHRKGSLSHTCEARSYRNWSCNCRSKDWPTWIRRFLHLNYVVGSYEPPLKAATFGGGIKSIRRTVCEISTALVWRKLLKLTLQLQKWILTSVDQNISSFELHCRFI